MPRPAPAHTFAKIPSAGALMLPPIMSYRDQCGILRKQPMLRGGERARVQLVREGSEVFVAERAERSDANNLALARIDKSPYCAVMLRAIDRDLWVAEQPLRFIGLQVRPRMTVVRLRDGSLWICSPLRLSAELRAQIDAIGPVRHLVAPNRYHHLFIQDWLTAYPDSQGYAVPGLPEKRPEVKFAGVLDDIAPSAWEGQLDQLLWRGVPAYNEVVFLHRQSRTLIMTDLVHNIGHETPLPTRLVYFALGGGGGFRTLSLDRLLARDRAAARASLMRVLSWNIERVIVAHGQILDSDGQAALRRAYAWLID